MPSIFDYIFNREAAGPMMPGQTGRLLPQASSNDPRPRSILDDSPSARDTLMGLSQGLLAAGAPSLMPMDFGAALGKGLSGALGANDEDKRLKRALVTSQVQKAQSDIANDKAWQDMFKTPAAAETAAPATTAPNALAPVLQGGGAPSGSLPTAWDPHYHKASADTGMSIELLKAKDLVESGGNANAVSPAGATGPAQLMPGTAADLGVTNSKDPAQAIDGGARYLKAQYDKYKNADIALMAYNWGPGNVDNWIRTGADPNAVPAETKGYLSKIHAKLGTAAPTFAATMPGPPPGLVPNATMAQMPGPPAGLTPTGGPPMAPMPQVAGPAQGQPGPIAQPPMQVAGMPPQGDAPPAVGPQIAQAPPAAPAPKTLPEVIQSLPPAVRQMMGAMPRKDALPLLLKYADPDTHVAIDTTTGAVVFAPKNDRSGRYQPVDAMKLDLDKQRVETERRQAAAREEANRIRGANEPLQPGGQPTPGYTEQKGVEEGAKAAAKVGPALLQHQGELVIKDSQGAQVAADHARVGIGNLSRLGALLDQVNTGKFQGTVQELKASAKAAGVDLDALGVGDNVGIAQAAKAMTGQLALSLRDPSAGAGMPGALSDQDRQFLAAMVPSITNDPNGNKLMLDWQKKIYQRSIDVAKIVNDYGRSPDFLKDPTGVYAKVREYAEKNPLFDPERDAPKAAGKSGSLPMPSAVRRFNPATGKLE